MVAETRAPEILTKVQDDIIEQTHISRKDPPLPNLIEFMSAQGTNTCCVGIQPTVRNP